MIKFFKKYLDRIERLESIVVEQDRLIDVAYDRHRVLFRFTLKQARDKNKRLNAVKNTLEAFESDLEEFSSFLHEVKDDLELEKYKARGIELAMKSLEKKAGPCIKAFMYGNPPKS